MKQVFILYILSITFLRTNSFAFDFSVVPSELSAHYISPSQPIKELKSKLKKNGFEIVATSSILNKHTIITITNFELKATNSYMSTLQINVNMNEIRVQNPSYLAAAYLGNKFKYGQFKKTINALENTLTQLNSSKQTIHLSNLIHYNFMYGMPFLEDTISIKKSNDLIGRVTKKNTKHILYTLKLPNGSILVGHKLRGKIDNFLTKLGQEKNSQLFPYESMIKGDEVTILDPKYYLALSLPQLSMGEFMKISSVPSEIEDDIKKVYK